ncbi:(2Fe-2S)-binding protein [Rhizobium tubonense]|uniref:(2Fe-2S)-binding protein n=1 Tax=Rhizobium tubonense TaxID=484088 RepID=A0A2W4CUJ3_9HYPH|nr:(2Fe-2S)-binding protein [Rhizobium tubonense]PZM14518.1 (2Fe-2S)-binding protein [Rhizobium tubonense]
MRPQAITLDVNGAKHLIELSPKTLLLFVLRNDLGLNGPKYGCGLGECGACAILVDGRSVRSCTVEIGAVEGKRIVTLEGLGTVERMHFVQDAFVKEQAAQCGYCLNGMIVAATALLTEKPDASEADIRRALGHHLCRCGTHVEILAAVRRARDTLSKGPSAGGGSA